jgi:hypothetical protein
MTAYIWNRPSHKKITIFFYIEPWSGSFGEVQPSTYPDDRGFYWGILIL